MAATATFALTIPPISPTDVSFLNGGFIAPGGQRKYQMIPTTGKSKWAIRFSGGTVRVTTKDKNVAFLGDDFARPLARNLLTFNSASAQTKEFFILPGMSAGRTVLVAEDAKGNNLDTVTISVKTVENRTFMIHRLVNRTMKTIREAQEIEAMLRTVKSTYLLQANTLLAQVGPVNDLLVTHDYGDPIDMTRRRPRPGAEIGETIDFNTDVIETLNRKGLFGKANLHMVSTCQIHGALGITPDFKNICYVSHTFTKGNLEPESTTWAHEIGHAFGLVHAGHNGNEMMVEGNVTNHQDSFVLTDADIDKINPTGT